MSEAAGIISVLGAGPWGTALSMQLARGGSEVRLWDFEPEHIEEIAATGRNRRNFPDLDLPEGLSADASLESAVRSANIVLVAVPSHAFGGLLESIRPWLPGKRLAWACKGFEPGTGRFLHEVASEVLGPGIPLAVVTGPSFAVEVARNLPTAVTVAGHDADFVGRFARALHHGNFRAYTIDDITGAELGGAVKNVMAIGTGICDGLGLGDNARAALITRGLAEMMRLGLALGARRETLMGLAGLGDLVLTCTGDLSRNRRLGLALGRGRGMVETMEEIGQVVEGVAAAREVRRLSKEHGVSMPISKQVHGILHQGWDPEEGVRRLLAREQKAEITRR
ncbi:MAG: NAD(P)H-dependent glycerol-3-phosphate dehydrogenase [Xanthomonadales bacterium]|nr:NAD(P)-dependent glycerol-3-phosphate dehydrogenase [Xanthomonadales bacterium]NIX11853.1 NAD(P)H-dependent glycerol-3-phosphate dehydrogenase [Xanthomonadales bacterium]